MPIFRVFTHAAVALSAVGGCAGGNQKPPKSPAPTPNSPAGPTASSRPVAPAEAAPEWFTVDSAGRTLSLELEVTSRTDAPSALINGYRAGGVRITVPVGWTVQWSWTNADSGPAHSLVVMVQREKIPLEGGRPSFSNAMTRMVTEGLARGQGDRTSFEAEESGWYWMLCGVPGHALEGEWIELRVDSEAKTARVEPKRA
jgi:hypothetical protein